MFTGAFVAIVTPFKDGRVDETALRDMFYDLSEKSIAFRFFQPVKSFPHKFIQEFTTIDFSKDMAIIVLVKDLGGDRIVCVAHYYLNPANNYAEVSFLVYDEWQAKGIGTIMLEILIDIARKRGIQGLEARVLANNQLMLSVFYNSGYKITTRREEDTYFIAFSFKEKA